MVVTLRRPCRCGHGKDEHQHYRRGTDCSGCECVSFHGQLELTLRFGRQQLPVVDVVVPDEIPGGYEPYVRPTHSAGLTTDRRMPPPVVHVAEPRAAEKELSLRKHSAG